MQITPSFVCRTVGRTEQCVCPQAALYEKLSSSAANDDEEHYNVDFLRKGLLSDEAPGMSTGGGRGSAPVDSALDALGQGGVRLPLLIEFMHQRSVSSNNLDIFLNRAPCHYAED